SAEAGQAETELRLTGALARFWHMRGHLDEGCEWLAGALERGAGGPVECLARALSGAAMLQAERGEWSAAQRLSQASLERYQELDDRQGMAVCLAQLARAQHRLGAGATARANGRRSLVLARECGDPWCVAQSLLHLAEIAVDRAEFDAARRLYDEGLSLALAIGDHWRAAGVLDGLAVVAVAQGRPRGGLRLAGAAELLLAALGAARSPLAQAHLDQCLASARAAVGSNIAAALQAEAKTQPPDQVARDAFGFEEAREPSSPVAVAHDAFRRLTRRERQVALVVAQGLHNRQIGHVLGVTEHTVEVHVSSVLGKLGLTSRARLTAWLVGHNLTMAEREPQAPWR
ncbi:MAG TPA: LuxR C-terminal-related transcriptional regulator, partial [Chloroflexota bacterium]|nr:LuxR C-terminal-related transcriptional regulator [Chloroflexota bacterium]